MKIGIICVLKGAIVLSISMVYFDGVIVLLISRPIHLLPYAFGITRMESVTLDTSDLLAISTLHMMMHVLSVFRIQIYFDYFCWQWEEHFQFFFLFFHAIFVYAFLFVEFYFLAALRLHKFGNLTVLARMVVPPIDQCIR